MNLFVSVKACVVLAALGAAATAAHATATTFFGNNVLALRTVSDGAGAGHDPLNQRNQFEASLASFQTEAFNQTPGNIGSLSDIFAAGSGVTLTSTDPNINTTSRVQNNPNPGGTPTGRFNTTGDPSVAVNTIGTSGWWETNKGTTTVQFTTAVSAFGTFITDAGDFRGALDVQIFNGASLLLSTSLISTGSGNVANSGALAFFGYTNDTTKFTSVVFTVSQAAGLPVGQFDFVGFDDFITGPLRAASIPEPSSITLAALSLGLLALARRRRTRA